MSWVGLEDTEEGIRVSVNDTPDVDGKFVAHPGPLLDRTSPHEIRFWIKVNQGLDNDLVRISVDGRDLGQCFTTWENYYRTAPEQAPPPNRNTPATINSLQFRSSVPGPPALLGNGYLFDNVSITPSDGPGPPGCDVPIEKTADSPTVTAGGRAGFRLTVRNRGRLAARNLRACDQIPRQMTFVSADRRLSRIGRKRCLTIPRLQPGQRVSFHLVLQVNAERAAGQSDEHRRGHAASGNDALARAGVAGQPGGAARGHHDAQSHRESQGRREDRQARAGSASTRTAEVHRITAIAGPLGSERPSPCLWASRSVGCCGPGCSDGFESGMDAEGPKKTADVVPDRLGAQVELGGHLLRRAALLQKTKHLDLTGGEMRGWRCGGVVGALLEQPEDTDHPFTVHQRHRTDLHGDPRAGGRNQDGRAHRWPGRCRAPSVRTARGRAGCPRARRRR